jgi:hypothetical protein
VRAARQKKPPKYVVSKRSEGLRPSYRKRFGHRSRAFAFGKPIYLPPVVYNELMVMIREAEKVDGRAYIYHGEFVAEMMGLL